MLLILRETEQFNVLSDDYWAEAKSDNDSLLNVGEYGKKTFRHIQQILNIKGVVSLGESVKKGKFMTNIFFQTMLNEVKKSCKK